MSCCFALWLSSGDELIWEILLFDDPTGPTGPTNQNVPPHFYLHEPDLHDKNGLGLHNRTYGERKSTL